MKSALTVDRVLAAPRHGEGRPMRCERRRLRWLVAVALALQAVACGDDADPDGDATSAVDAPAETEATGAGPGPEEADEDGEDLEDAAPLTEAPAVELEVGELCDRLADVDLDEVFSEDLRQADPGTGGDDGCAYASELADGDMAPDVDALVTVARTAGALDEDTVAGEAGGGLPDLEPLPGLGDRGAIRAFRTQNEYIDSWEAWVFLSLDEGLLRIQTRDPGWDDRDDAVDATLELLEALDVPTT